MIRLLKHIVLAVALLGATVAHADVGDWYGTLSAAYFDDDGDRLADDGVAGGQVQVGREMGDNFWLEGMLGYHDIGGYPGQKHLEVGVNAIGNMLPDSTFSPYLLVGAGFLSADVGLPDFGGYPPAGSSTTDFTATAGFGFKIKFGESPLALRAEWRFRHAFNSDKALTDSIGTVGFQYNFGGSSDAAPAAPVAAEPFALTDSDGDGVIDLLDNCPNTSRGFVVDLYGCPTDLDQDGVKNELDTCPGTAPGARADLVGCEFPETIDVMPVYFALGAARLTPEAEETLDEAAALLKRHPGLPIEVAGHSDNVGPADINMSWSVVRAEVVRLYLEQAGVRASSLTVRGYGETQPVGSNDTAAGRAQNRRVVLEMRER